MIVKHLKINYMNELSKDIQGNEVNTLLYTGRCLIRNRMMYFYSTMLMKH
jgi:hypothetical protein